MYLKIFYPKEKRENCDISAAITHSLAIAWWGISSSALWACTWMIAQGLPGDAHSKRWE